MNRSVVRGLPGSLAYCRVTGSRPEVVGCAGKRADDVIGDGNRLMVTGCHGT